MSLEEPLDYDRLERHLLALASSSRLELLDLLRFPQQLQDVRLAARATRPGENPDRIVSRQTVQLHLDKLMEVGLVVARDPQAPGRRGKEYVANPQRIYQVLEEIRKIGMVTLDEAVPRDATVDLGAVRRNPPVSGPRLVLVHGLLDGHAFPLRVAALRDGRGWVLGRKPGLHVSIEYDPYVSLENAEILPEGDGFVLMDLRTSRNGTFLNWRRLERGECAPLQPGDVIGVGRSYLVFRSD